MQHPPRRGGLFQTLPSYTEISKTKSAVTVHLRFRREGGVSPETGVKSYPSFEKHKIKMEGTFETYIKMITRL
jgi:hypothetical protein